MGESIKLENQITQLKEQKSDILIEVIEAEKQILLWERKYQLEKEMQDALDPTIGQTEIVAMKKEIHRMQLQYELFRKEQEKLIKDMERSVFKRETIQLKYLPKVEKKNAQDKSSQGKISRARRHQQGDLAAQRRIRSGIADIPAEHLRSF